MKILVWGWTVPTEPVSWKMEGSCVAALNPLPMETVSDTCGPTPKTGPVGDAWQPCRKASWWETACPTPWVRNPNDKSFHEHLSRTRKEPNLFKVG